MCRSCPRRNVCTRPCAKLEAELKKVTGAPDWREIMATPQALAYIWTSRSRMSLAELQAASVVPPLELILTLLTDGQREVVWLVFHENMSIREVAATLHKGKTSVHEQLTRAKKRIRAYLLSQKESSNSSFIIRNS